MLKTNKSLLKDPELLDLTCVGERGGGQGVWEMVAWSCGEGVVAGAEGLNDLRRFSNSFDQRNTGIPFKPPTMLIWIEGLAPQGGDTFFLHRRPYPQGTF